MTPRFTTVEIPCISIGHLFPETEENLRYLASYFGFKVADADDSIFMTTCADRDGLPQDLLDIMAWADKHAKFGWILLDVDGDVQPDLPTY